MSIIKSIKEGIFYSFKKYLENEIKDNRSVETILNKGKKIIQKFESMHSKNDKKFLLIGKIQSGKTVNFLSIIANSFLIEDNYEFVFVLTSIDKKLHNQTVDRIKDSFDYKMNKNYLKIFDLNDPETKKMIKKNGNERIIEENKKNKLIIFTLLKNPKNLEIIEKLFKSSDLNNKKILIIDDEGDLASFSKNSKNREMKTLESIKSLFNSLLNPAYISVTATPQVQYLTPREEEMIPRKVFCVEAGKEYSGLNIFTDDKYYKIVKKPEKKDDETEFDLLREALIYYMICWVNHLHEESIKSWPKKHSNFLIHTDVKTTEHEKIKKEIDKYLEEIRNSFSDNDYKQTTIIAFKEITKEYEIKDYLDDKEYLDKLEWCFNTVTTNVINQQNHEELNDNFATINIGSRMLERGITLDNLIVTYFTNRSDQSKTAIDTLLQRARWFGYRNHILKYVKIFTTNLVKENFKEIKRIDDNLWMILNDAEKEDLWFDEIDREIILKKDSKLKPTFKTPLTITSSRNLPSLFVNYLKENREKFMELFNKLKKSKEFLKINESNIFKCISYDNIDLFFRDFPYLKNLLFNLNLNFDEIRNLNLKVCLLDKNGKPRERSCQSLNGGYKIKELFQGKSNKYVEGLENKEYVGDANWNKIKEYKDKLLLQIHYLDVYNDHQKKLNDLPIFAWALIVPEHISNKFDKFKPLEDKN